MMNESMFDALNKHLAELQPIFDTFCARHGFQYVDRKALGRYPRVHIIKSGQVTIWFDLWMELDEKGLRHEVFSSDLPYELSAGAYAILTDDAKHRRRVQKAIQCFQGRPFRDIEKSLEDELERNVRIVQQWDLRFLQEHGKTISLGE
jgi:hypothetical protein